MSDDQLYMRRCLELAAKGKGLTSPNPMVGAVLVHGGRVIGEGLHERYGGPHAEINCLASVREEDRPLIRESTMYVSLEPCAHHGKTPPCATRLAEERVKEVVICNSDPFEQVNGKGMDILNAHGILTRSGVLEEQGAWLNRRFFCFHREQRPYIILKWAQTEQGYFAPADRARMQLSNRHSAQLVHKWRTEEAAILAGTRTVLNDDPQLTARSWNGRQPLRIVIDRALRLPGTLNIFNKDAPTWIINASREEVQGNTRYIKLDFTHDILPQLLQRLHEAGMLSLIVEGGAALLDSFISRGLWHEARIFRTPDILGEGVPAPLLTNAAKAFTSQLDTDELLVCTNNGSAYRYAPEMEL